MLIIFNPIAGAGRQRRLARALAELRARGVSPELVETRARGDAERIARDATRGPKRAVVAAGGDGTIAEVAAGLAGSTMPLGLLPLGTANVLAQELGVPLRPEAAAATLVEGLPRLLHPALARFGDGREVLFVQMLGAGFDAEVVARLDPGLKRRLGRLSYVLQSIRELPRYRFPPITVTADGTAHQAASVIVTKGRLYAGRYRVAPNADPTRPGFQIVLFQHGGAASAALAGAALPLGLVPHLPGVLILPAHQVTLTSDAPVPAQADGDAVGELPVTIVDAPSALRILLPRSV